MNDAFRLRTYTHLNILYSEMNDNQSHSSYKVYKNDPVSMKSYVHKFVFIKTRDGRVYDGVVYTIDPVSESIILINPATDDLKMKLIMGHAIEGMELSSESETRTLPDLFLSSARDLPESVILRRKNAVRELLLLNRFPVTETNNILNIEGMVSIEPPYDPERCISNNEIVLLRIQQLISSIVS